MVKIVKFTGHRTPQTVCCLTLSADVAVQVRKRPFKLKTGSNNLL